MIESKDSKDQGKDNLQCLNAMLAKMQRDFLYTCKTLKPFSAGFIPPLGNSHRSCTEFAHFPQNLRVCLAHLVPPVHFHFGKGVFPFSSEVQRSAFISQKRSQSLPSGQRKFPNPPSHTPLAPNLTPSPP